MENTLNFNDFYGTGVEEEVQEKERFKITDLSSADWVLRKRQEIIDDLEASTEYAKAEMQKYQNFITNQEKAAEEQIAYFNYLIEEYLREQKAENPKYKLQTAVGQANFRNSKTWRYEEDEIMNFLKENDMNEFIRVTESINKAEMKKKLKATDAGMAVTEDGEIVPGITIENIQTLSIKME